MPNREAIRQSVGRVVKDTYGIDCADPDSYGGTLVTDVTTHIENHKDTDRFDLEHKITLVLWSNWGLPGGDTAQSAAQSIITLLKDHNDYAEGADICHQCGANWTRFNEDDSLEFEPPCFCDLTNP